MRKIETLSALLLWLLVLSHPARAQSGLFLSGNVFADAQRLSGDSASTLDATKVGGGGGVGLLVAERWDVRAEVEMGAKTTLTRPLLPPVQSFQSRTRTRIAATSVVVGFRPVSRPRLQVTVLGGISFLHVRTQLDSIPSGLVVSPHTHIDNVAGPTIGAEVPIMLFRHVSVVPEARAHAFTLSNGTGGFAIRPGIGIRWSM